MNKLNANQQVELLNTLKSRFTKNPNRHPNIDWSEIQKKLEKFPAKLKSLELMESTVGEPDVIGLDPKTGEYIFCDCSPESPSGRRSLCYDRLALDSRKSFKPKDSAIDMAKSIGVELLTEEQYQDLQKLGEFDLKTSSWLLTPAPIRKLGGAIFADRRYNHVFVYHNGADSYYASRGFRGLLRV